MGSFIQKIKDKVLEEGEEIEERAINKRRVDSASSFVFLTNKRIIYKKENFIKQLLGIGKDYRTIDLEEIEDVMYNPKPLHSGGHIEAITKEGNKKNLTPSFIGQERAEKFKESVREKL